jgi:hypothetical protein
MLADKDRSFIRSIINSIAVTYRMKILAGSR